MTKRQMLALDITIGCLIGCLAGAGALKSTRAYQAEKHEALAEYIEEIEETEVTAEAAEAYPVVEMTEEELADQEYWDSLELLSLLVEAEAGNQSLLGKRLVVDVVLNRVDSEDFPDTIEEVILQDAQFSCVLDGGLDDAGWHMQQDDYDAVLMELEERTDDKVLYFTAYAYGEYGTPAYREGDHYFSYE